MYDYGSSKETLCGTCQHLKVCALKQQFLNAQQAVDNVSVTIDNRCADGRVSMKYLRDFDWIKPVSLGCVHFLKDIPSTRDCADPGKIF